MNIMRRLSLPLLLMAALLAASCEKKEIILVDSPDTFCPIHFRMNSRGVISAGCQWGPTRGETTFDKQDNQLILKHSLAGNDHSFLARVMEDDPYFYVLDRAYDLSTVLSSHDFHFEKLNMDIGTRISLYLGATWQPAGDSTQFYMGNLWAGIPAGPSMQHRWQVYVQREEDSSYTLGCMANGEHVALHTGIADFKGAGFLIHNSPGRSIVYANLHDGNPLNSIVQVNTENLNLPPIPENLFTAVGIDIVEQLKNTCETRSITIKPIRYAFTNNRPNEQLFDFFECNTILK